MLYLLLAVALCLLLPWLPVLMYRRLPRRPAPPLADWQLRQLAEELRPGTPEAAPAFVEGEELIAVRAAGAAPSAPPSRPEAVPPAAEGQPTAPAPASPPRLSIGPYRWVNWLAVPVFPAAMLALGFGLAMLFHFLGEARARGFGPAVFLFTPLYGLVCAVPALFLGIFTTLPVMALLTRLLLGRRRFREYLFWDEGRIAARPGVTPDAIIRLLSWLALVAGVLSAAFVLFALNWHVRFTEDEVVIRRLFAVREEAHPYGSVEQVVWTTHVDQGEEVVPRNDVHLRFSDGRTWHMDMNFFRAAGGAGLEGLLDFLRAKTGRPVTRARLIEDVPGW